MKHDQHENLSIETNDRRDNKAASTGDAYANPEDSDARGFNEAEATDFGVEAASASSKKPRGHKRRIVTGVALLAITIVCVGALYYTFRPSRSVKVSLKAKQPRQAQDATDTNNKAPDDVTAEAIAEVRSAISSPAVAKPTLSSPSVLPSTAPNLGGATSSTVLPPDNSLSDKATVTHEPEASASSASRRNHEQSIRFPDEDESVAKRISNSTGHGTKLDDATSTLSVNRENEITRRSRSATYASLSTKSSAKAAITPAVLPSFGSVLPVRTLGKIYTLRSGSSVRLELTRYVTGEGWSLPKGTVLVGQVRGSERDRAFIAVTGFIDPSRAGFVNLTAEVLGDDGGSGIQGKFHKLSSGWSRAFARVGSAAVNVAGAIAGSRISGQPVIITDIGSRTVSPFSYEVDSALLQQNRGFVEVPAGTAAFVMVTTLPSDVKGVDAQPEHLASFDTAPAIQPTALSQEELALLLTSGDASRIRDALPRMSPSMRQIAESVLAETATKQSDRERNQR
jgi:hypothetical protein